MPLSFTQLSTYRRCPRQYEYLYVKKIPKGISPGEAFGSAVHNTLKKWGEREIENGEWRIENSTKQMEMFTESVVPQVSALSLGALEKIWHENFPLNSFSTRVEADAARMRGEELMTYFYSWWSELPREVVAVEKGFSVQMNNEELAMSNDKNRKSSIANRKSSSPGGSTASSARPRACTSSILKHRSPGRRRKWMPTCSFPSTRLRLWRISENCRRYYLCCISPRTAFSKSKRRAMRVRCVMP